MSAAFDPYYQWLSIPPAEQPPHHYRLLGVEIYESNLDVIENAADRQMKHLRDCQTGKHGADSQRLLSEIAAVRVSLLDPEKKAAYDAELQAKIAAKKKERARQERPLAVATPLPDATWGRSPELPEQPQAAPPPEKPAVAAPTIATAGRRRGSKSLAPLLIAGGGLLLLAIVAAGAAVVFWPQPNTGSNNVAVVTSPNPPDTSPPDNSTDPAPQPPVTIAPPPPPPVTHPKEPPPDENVEPRDDPPPVTQIDEHGPPADDSPDDPSPPEAAPKKLAVPAKEIRDQRRQQIAAIFPIDAARTFEEKGQLAANLIRTARDTKGDPPAQFALLNLARDQAAEAGQIKLAFEAIELLNEVFEFPADNVRVASLDAAAKAAIPPATKRDIVTLGMGMIDGFIAADEFDKADALSERMITIARPLRDAELIKSLADQRRTIDDLSAVYRKAKTAFETLKTAPDDPAANLAAGRYLTFVKQDWAAGLPHLAKGSDDLLAAAAVGELANPQAAAEREKLADTWWAAGEAQKDTNSKDLCRALAGESYRKIVGQLTGLSKVKVEKRIEEAALLTKNSLQVVYLDDLQELDSKVGHGVLGKHGTSFDSVREYHFQQSVPDHTLTLHATEKGISHVTYKLADGVRTFEATAALWQSASVKRKTSFTPIVFRIVGDGKLLWQSDPLVELGTSQDCRVNIEGVRTLTLQVVCPGDFQYGWSVWINPRISRFDAKSANTEPDLGVFSRDPAELAPPRGDPAKNDDPKPIRRSDLVPRAVAVVASGNNGHSICLNGQPLLKCRRDKASSVAAALKPGDVITVRLGDRFDIMSLWMMFLSDKGEYLFETSDRWIGYLPANREQWWDTSTKDLQQEPAQFTTDRREYVKLVKESAAAAVPKYKAAQPIFSPLQGENKYGDAYLAYVVTVEDLKPKQVDAKEEPQP